MDNRISGWRIIVNAAPIRFPIANELLGTDQILRQRSDDWNFDSYDSICGTIGSISRLFSSINGSFQDIGLHTYGDELKEGNEGYYPGSQHYITVNRRILFLFMSAVLGWAIIWGGIYVSVTLRRRVSGFTIMGIGMLLPGAALLLWLLTPI
jgi:hypothetical protein